MMSLKVVSYSTKAAVKARIKPAKTVCDVVHAGPAINSRPPRFLMDFLGPHFDATRLVRSHEPRKVVAARPKVLPT